MASKRIGGRPVDLGAAYFTVRDPEFAQVVARWRMAGLARPWTSELAVLGSGERSRTSGPVRWAAPGGLRSLVAALAEGLPVDLEHEVRRVGPGPTVDGERADVVVLAMPDPQARRLLNDDAPATALVGGRRWRSVIAVAAGWQRREWPPMPAAFVNDHPLLSLVADDGDRRGDGAPVLVAHTTDELARRCDAQPDDAVAPVLDALRDLLGLRSDPVWTHAHRWRYASPPEDRDAPFHLGEDGISLAGDGWGRSRVETAWRSGTALGRALIDRSRKVSRTV
jgi:predicted NAD/FAD-dependent oxidoreductase